MSRITSCNLHVCLVFLSCFLVAFVHVGLLFSLSTIFEDIMSTFKTSRAETAVIHSTAIAVGMGTGLLSGALIHRFGIVLTYIDGASSASIGIMTCYFSTSTVHMIVCIGIIYATGINCVFVSSSTVISQTFHDKWVPFMLSLQSTSVAIGGMIYPYILAYLSDVYGFRGALLILGGFSMNCIPMCLLWKKTTIKEKTNCDIGHSECLRQYEQSTSTRVTRNADEITIQTVDRCVSAQTENDRTYIDSFPVLYNNAQTRRVTVQCTDANRNEQAQTIFRSVKAVIRKTTFVIFVIGFVLTYPSILVILVLVTDVFVDKNLTLNDATFGLFLMNIINIFGRLLVGAIIQSKRIPAMLCPLLASLITSIVLIGLPSTALRNFVVGFLAITGIPVGMNMAMLNVIPAKLIKRRRDLPTAIGILLSVNGIGIAVAGPLSGYIRDISGSYSVPFYAAAAVTMLSTLLFAFALAKQKTKKQNQSHRSSVFYLTSM